MKTLKRSILTGIMLTVLFSLVFSASYAQKTDKSNRAEKEMVNPTPPDPPDGRTYHRHQEVGRNDMRDARPLDLPNMTDEQKEKIKQARLENMKAMTPLKNQAREKKAKLQTLLTTTPVDLKMADQVADELGKIGTEIMKRMIRHDQEIRNLLTPEQQVMYDARPKPFLQKVK
jgi:Spy/CpxP family protein refolding chaperone